MAKTLALFAYITLIVIDQYVCGILTHGTISDMISSAKNDKRISGILDADITNLIEKLATFYKNNGIVLYPKLFFKYLNAYRNIY